MKTLTHSIIFVGALTLIPHTYGAHDRNERNAEMSYKTYLEHQRNNNDGHKEETPGTREDFLNGYAEGFRKGKHAWFHTEKFIKWIQHFFKHGETAEDLTCKAYKASYPQDATPAYREGFEHGITDAFSKAPHCNQGKIAHEKRRRPHERIDEMDQEYSQKPGLETKRHHKIRESMEDREKEKLDEKEREEGDVLSHIEDEFKDIMENIKKLSPPMHKKEMHSHHPQKKNEELQEKEKEM